MLEYKLVKILNEIKMNDRNYPEREPLIYKAVGLAAAIGYTVGIRIHDDWPVIVIKLPIYGQVSWHMKPETIAWDGHDKNEKYQRIEMYVEEYGSKPDGMEWHEWRTCLEDVNKM